jgi:hypothetical protein
MNMIAVVDPEEFEKLLRWTPKAKITHAIKQLIYSNQSQSFLVPNLKLITN